MKFFSILILLLPSLALANYTCTGKVTGVSIEPSTGDLIVQKVGPLNWPRLCSVDTEVRGISADACKIVYSTLLTAQTTGKEVRLWFNDSGDCTDSSHAPWQSLTGWYFGPKLHEE